MIPPSLRQQAGSLFEAANYRIEEIVRFVGPRNDAAAIMRLIDLLAVPSLVETTPFVILEAMAAGRPVVASRIYGIPEMIEEDKSGTLVNPSDPEDLARALLRTWHLAWNIGQVSYLELAGWLMRR